MPGSQGSGGKGQRGGWALVGGRCVLPAAVGGVRWGGPWNMRCFRLNPRWCARMWGGCGPWSLCPPQGSWGPGWIWGWAPRGAGPVLAGRQRPRSVNRFPPERKRVCDSSVSADKGRDGGLGCPLPQPIKERSSQKDLKIALRGHFYQPPACTGQSRPPAGLPGLASGHVTPRGLHPGAGQEAPSGGARGLHRHPWDPVLGAP